MPAGRFSPLGIGKKSRVGEPGRAEFVALGDFVSNAGKSPVNRGCIEDLGTFSHESEARRLEAAAKGARKKKTVPRRTVRKN